MATRKFGKDDSPIDFLRAYLQDAVIALRAAAAWATDEGLDAIADDCNEADATAEKNFYALRKKP